MKGDGGALPGLFIDSDSHVVCLLTVPYGSFTCHCTPDDSLDTRFSDFCGFMTPPYLCLPILPPALCNTLGHVHCGNLLCMPSLSLTSPLYDSPCASVQALLTALASSGSGRDVVQAVETALPVLLDRLSDNNSRLRDSARDALVALAQEPEGRAALRTQVGDVLSPS